MKMNLSCQSWHCYRLFIIGLIIAVGHGCGGGSSSSVDAGYERGDGGVTNYPSIADPIAHVPADARHLGYLDLTLDGSLIGDSFIDTTEMTIDGLAYPREDRGPMVFDHWEVTPVMLDWAPELAILHVRSFIVPAGQTVRVFGDRPLVILAETITIDGVLDASAHGQEPGPGGRLPGMGYTVMSQPGTAGQDGTKSVATTWADGGGGGAAYATGGGNGGSSYPYSSAPDCGSECGEAGVGGGPIQNIESLVNLIGGSGGGSSSSDGIYGDCLPGRGGAGGGAVQMYALDELSIGPDGGINVGGGGGEGGDAYLTCPTEGDFLRRGDTTGGGGGGSGGAIYLQASRMTLHGILAANGGGGGGGAGRELGPEHCGQPGQDGRLEATPATGGAPGSPEASAGGAGGARGLVVGDDRHAEDAQWNAGGGGGSVGHISLHVASDGTYENEADFSPLPYEGTYEPAR